MPRKPSHLHGVVVTGLSQRSVSAMKRRCLAKNAACGMVSGSEEAEVGSAGEQPTKEYSDRSVGVTLVTDRDRSQGRSRSAFLRMLSRRFRRAVSPSMTALFPLRLQGEATSPATFAIRRKIAKARSPSTLHSRIRLFAIHDHRLHLPKAAVLGAISDWQIPSCAIRCFQ